MSNAAAPCAGKRISYPNLVLSKMAIANLSRSTSRPDNFSFLVDLSTRYDTLKHKVGSCANGLAGRESYSHERCRCVRVTHSW